MFVQFTREGEGGKAALPCSAHREGGAHVPCLVQTPRSDGVLEAVLPHLDASRVGEKVVQQWPVSTLMAAIGDIWAGKPGAVWFAGCGLV